jgi:uracil-DNA glycosylase family protein
MPAAPARTSTDPERWLAAAERGDADVAVLAEAAARCRACPLWRRGTQTVFGRGVPRASVVLVGEQPGDQEDRDGLPFVGPAGRLLREALAEAGIAPEQLYLTNAVKHFKWTPRGKRRIHERPNANEVRACRPWLLAEIAALRPRAIVCLGATATQALLGSSVRVLRDRGRWLPSPLAPAVMATVHPSSLLRAPTPEARAEARALFAADLRVLAARLREPSASSEPSAAVVTEREPARERPRPARRAASRRRSARARATR